MNLSLSHLSQMPIDTPEHIRMAWMTLCRLDMYQDDGHLTREIRAAKWKVWQQARAFGMFLPWRGHSPLVVVMRDD